MTIDFNHDWRFVGHNAETPEEAACGEGLAINLPHTWNADDMVPGGPPPLRGKGWYVKRFTLPTLEDDQRLLVEFEAIGLSSEVWLNGAHVGGYKGGYLGFCCDLTDALVEGNNILVVMADNSVDPISNGMPRFVDWNPYGGIYRPAWLHLREHVHLDYAGVQVWTDVSDDEARASVTVDLLEHRLGKSNVVIRHRLLDPRGKQLSETTEELCTRYARRASVTSELPPVTGPELWSTESPSLYTLETNLLEDGRELETQQNRVGFRYFRFDKNDGFFLNGKPLKLHGVNVHQDFPGLGSACPARYHEKEVALLKEMGCNYLRTSHYPRNRRVLDLCDEHGILVMEEQPVWHGSIRAEFREAFIETVEHHMHDMVRQHRNHPCIIIWNLANEVMLVPVYKHSEAHVPPDDPRRETMKVKPTEYPFIRRCMARMYNAVRDLDDRPISLVVGGRWQMNDDLELTQIPELVAYNRGAMGYFGTFDGPKTGKSYEFLPDYYRDVYPERIHLMSEGVILDRPLKRNACQEFQEVWPLHAKYWNDMESRKWFCGGSMWCFTDYVSNGLYRIKGVLDYSRLPNDLFFFYKAMWHSEPVLHIVGHWNYNEGEGREVVVFTNCDEVELCLNGRSFASGQSTASDWPHLAQTPIIWRVPFEKGVLTATGIRNGRHVSCRRQTSSEPESIRLIPEPGEIRGDGRDVSFVTAELLDAAGTVCLCEDRCIRVEAEGVGDVAGPAERDMIAGRARFAVRSSGGPGWINVRAHVDEMTAEATINAS